MISQETETLYRRQSARFIQWVADQDRETPDIWADALQHYAGHLSLKSWRLYRNALTWHMRETYGPVETERFLRLTDAGPKPPMKRKRLQRRVDPQVLKILLTHLCGMRGSMGRRVADLMVATIATGIRPSEWQAVTRPDARRIRVQNAKFRPNTPLQPGRGNGRVRELVLSERIVGSEVDVAINRTMLWLQEHEWKSVQPSTSRTLKAALGSLIAARQIGEAWRKLRIYDCRHQFSADAKATLDLFGGEVAAAMGHGSAMTAIEHYGKRQHGRSGRTMVRPSQASVQAVRQETLDMVRLTVKEDAGRRLANKGREPTKQDRPSLRTGEVSKRPESSGVAPDHS